MMLLLNLTSVQNYLARKAASILSEKLNTKVAIAHVRIDFLNHILIQGLYIEDQQKDTLAYVGEAQTRMSDWIFIKKETPVLHFVGLTNAYFHLYRTATSKNWNYKFIEDAFGSNSTKKTNKQQNFELDVKKVLFDNVRFHMDDAWGGYDYDIDIGKFGTNVKQLDFNKHLVEIRNIALDNASISIHDFEGGKPHTPPRAIVIDSTPFNTDKWKLSVSDFNLKDCHFLFRSKEGAPDPKVFDPQYIEVSNINISVQNMVTIGDTIRAKVAHFSAKERSGFIVKELKSKVSVSPIASICDSLYLETNNSKLHDYYAMHYDRFPDFLDYIGKVRMVGHLVNSTVSTEDVAFFAPQLHKIPAMMLKVSGKSNGTVDKLAIQDLLLTDGFSTVKGNVSFVGLPDIDNTWINFQNGAIFSTGASVLRYVPSLKDNPNINLKTLDYVYFNGNFKGYISDFAATADIKTNLGNITADIKMKMPTHQQPTYSGRISSSNFNIGRLFNQTLVGSTTLNAELQGASFDEDGLHIKANSTIQSISLNGYNYKDIVADGIWEQKKFTGKMLVNDSNLSLGFYGNIDLSKHDLTINATANVLKCDLQKLNITSIPTMLSADFDLNCSGKTIDDFVGSAKLYNINLLRRKKRLDLDSINIVSYLTEGIKNIDIESNLLSAKINGQFKLTEIPSATQYFLAQYLPNYIKEPAKVAENQNLSFDIATHQVEEMLVAFTNNFHGFNNSNFKGNLNTSTQSLTLNATIPFGQIGSARFSNSSISSKGDLNKLSLSASIDTFRIGDNLLNTTMAIDASVGRDSLIYKIATKSSEQYGTATVNGKAYASHDTLYMSFLPSELYLNNIKWDIPSGSKIVYSKDYLLVKDFNLKSGVQELSVNSDEQQASPDLLIHSTNIDLALLASLSKLSAYQPDGRISGDIKIKDLFKQPMINMNIKANGVKMATDTIGSVVIVGDYDLSKSLLTLQSESGIFNDKFSITTNGKISLDSTSGQSLNGQLTINNLPTKLLSPFLQGYASRLSGTIDGAIDLTGTVSNPTTTGTITLNNIGAKVDYIGSYYEIPKGTISLNKQRATLDNIILYDVYKNTAKATGYLEFANIQNVQMNIQLKTPQFEVINLKEYENTLFYGHAIANTDFSINGSVSDMRMNIRATPTQASHIYIPYNSSGDISTNNYISFKSYGTAQPNIIKKNKSKLSVKIETTLNTLTDVTFVIDPKTGDQINATGDGNLFINVPANDDYTMFGKFDIERGDYTFTFRQVFIKKFIINSGSNISFSGGLANTNLDINATYPAKARLYDLLNANEITQLGTGKDLDDAKTAQNINVNLKLKGRLSSFETKYNIELAEKRNLGSIGQSKLANINQSNDNELFNQVTALLFFGAFIPPEGISNNMVQSTAKTTGGELLVNSASPLLTNLLNNVLGDKKLSVLLQYKNYSFTDNSTANPDAINRNEVKVGLQKKYFKDRLSLQVGSAYDWGRPTANNSNSSNLNLAGDFRAQYLLSKDGGISLTGFRTSNYDAVVNNNISRTGVGISFRKSFDNLFEFFHSKKRVLAEKQNRDTAKNKTEN
jgi:hypothetical protein